MKKNVDCSDFRICQKRRIPYAHAIPKPYGCQAANPLAVAGLDSFDIRTHRSAAKKAYGVLVHSVPFNPFEKKRQRIQAYRQILVCGAMPQDFTSSSPSSPEKSPTQDEMSTWELDFKPWLVEGDFCRLNQIAILGRIAQKP
jgi:hypothetical protein